MNLDELKNNWEVLNERLTRTEILNQRLIKEMIASRGKSTINKFLINEKILTIFFWVSLFIGLLSTVLFLVVSESRIYPLGISLTIFSVPILIWQMKKISLLRNINFMEKSVTENSILFFKYKKWHYKEMFWGTPYVIFFMFLFTYMSDLYTYKTFILLFILGTLLAIPQEIYFYKSFKKTNSVLEELKEFEKEEPETE